MKSEKYLKFLKKILFFKLKIGVRCAYKIFKARFIIGLLFCFFKWMVLLIFAKVAYVPYDVRFTCFDDIENIFPGFLEFTKIDASQPIVVRMYKVTISLFTV